MSNSSEAFVNIHEKGYFEKREKKEILSKPYKPYLKQFNIN